MLLLLLYVLLYICIGTIIWILLQLPIPWKSLLLSKALVVNLVTQTGSMWGLTTLSTQAPSYFNFVLGLNIKQVYLTWKLTITTVKTYVFQTGLWSGMPHFFRWAFSFGFSMICDSLVKSERMSLTNVRKIATVFCKRYINELTFMIFKVSYS